MAHNDTIEFYRGLDANVAGASGVLADGEPMWATDTLILYVVQGGTAYAINAFRGVVATSSATQSIASGSFASVTLGAENYDTSAFHDTVTNNSRLTIPTGLGGYYRLDFLAQWAASQSTTQVQIKKNGTTVVWGPFSLDSGTLMQGSAILNLSAGDYVELQIKQASGSNQTLNSGSIFGATRLGS